MFEKKLDQNTEKSNSELPKMNSNVNFIPV